MPAIELAYAPDAMSGINVMIMTQNFRLGPPPPLDSSSALRGQGSGVEGHAHLYLNGRKLRRIYGSFLHLDGALLEPGGNELRVSLNDHHHNTWVKGDDELQATVFLRVAEDGSVSTDYQFAPFALTEALRGEWLPAAMAALSPSSNDLTVSDKHPLSQETASGAEER